MPRVPTYDNFQTTPNTVPQVQLRAPDMPDTVGAQLSQQGQAFTQAGGQFARVALDMQNEANQLRVDDALNKAKEAQLRLTYDQNEGFTNLRGLSALDRQSGKPLADEYGENFQKQIQDIAGGLGNDAQRAAFMQRSNDLLTSFRGQALAHESAQFREYAVSVREGTVANRINEIGLKYNNPQVVDEAITAIKAATYDQARLLGRSAEWAEAQARKMTSTAHKTALGAALEKNDIGFADAYLKKYSKDMDADDILRARGLITKELDTKFALTTASEVIRTIVPKVVNTDVDRAYNILIGAESGGRQFGSDGKPLTSSAGAVGKAQVMEATGPEAAKLAGLPWDKARWANDGDYNEALGRAYFQKQLQDFGGNLAQAYAAYNAGPGAVRDFMDGTNKTGKNPNKIQTPGGIPPFKETQDYVAKNMKAYESGQGVYQKPTLLDVQTAVRERVGTDNPTRLRLALDEAERQYGALDKAIKQREDETVAGAMRGLLENGGRFSELPISVRANIPPKEIDNVMAFGARVAKGDDVTNLAVYQKLVGDPTYLRNLDDNAFFRLRGELSQADFKKFSDERAALKTGRGSNGPGELNTEAINQVLGNRLTTLGINPKPKADDTADAMRVGAIQRFVRDSIFNAQTALGKKMTDAEVEKHVDGLFAKSQEFRSTFLGFNTGSSSERLLTMKAGDIPGAVKNKLRQDFKAQGIPDPTDADLLGAYWQLKFAQR